MREYPRDVQTFHCNPVYEETPIVGEFRWVAQYMFEGDQAFGDLTMVTWSGRVWLEVATK